MQAIAAGRTVSPRAMVSAIAIAIAMAGCGGGSGGDATAGTGGEEPSHSESLSPVKYREEAAEGCRKARSGYREKAQRFLALERHEKSRRALYVDLTHLVLLPRIEAEMAVVGGLGTPPRGLEPVEKALDEAEFIINFVVYEPRIRSIAAVYRQFTPVSRIFRSVGLPECVNGSSVIGLR